MRKTDKNHNGRQQTFGVNRAVKGRAGRAGSELQLKVGYIRRVGV